MLEGTDLIWKAASRSRQ